MSYLLTAVLVLALMPIPSTVSQAKQQDVMTLVDGVQQKFRRMRDFSADFQQIEQNSLNQRRQSSGHLFLAKDRKMRWQYAPPQENVLVSDGKTVYWLNTADRQVNKDDVKNISDDRIPLMFLLGRSDLKQEFQKFSLLGREPVVGGMRVIGLTPKKKDGDLREVELEVDPNTFLIHRLVLIKADDGRMEFTFSKIETDTNLPSDLFKFTPPPGVEVVNGFGQ